MRETPSTATVSEPAAFRSEHDLIGDRDVPADVYWGVHTLQLRPTMNWDSLTMSGPGPSSGPATKSLRGNCMSGSWWTLSRVVPGRRRT